SSSGYLPSGNLGEAYETKLQASGAIAPYSYAVTGLPDGLTLNGDTISGIPTKPDQGSSFDTSITVTDAAGNVQTFGRRLSINGPNWTLNTLPNGKQDLDYGLQKLEAAGAVAPYSYVVQGLPTGLASDNAGAVSGTPTQPGIFPINITVTDAMGNEYQKAQNLTITAAPSLDLDISSLVNGKEGLDYGSRKIVATGSSGFVYEVTGLPEGLSFDGTNTVSGTPTKAGTFPVAIKATDKDGYVFEKTKDIVIAPAPVIDVDLSALPGGKVGLDYGSHKLAA
ncbi:putative Ig domain-containing protein, partial [Brucella anthropi]|uniref:putative Ig domain-containing protein n=1 Tax=Brucella anthropi TaxID=529 RepID=UPI0015FE3BE8